VASIPAYNEEKSLAKVIIMAQKYVDKVIVCDDGSKDMTRKIAENSGAEVISHPRNMGYGAALHSLFRRARELDANVMVTLDGDGQHNPDDIPSLVETLLSNSVDVVNGSRFLKPEESRVPLVRRIGIKFFTGLIRILFRGGGREIAVTDALCGMRCYGKRAIQTLILEPIGKETNVNVQIIREISSKGLLIEEVPISVKYDGPDCHKRSGVALAWQIFNTTLIDVITEHPFAFLLLLGSILGIAGMSIAVFHVPVFGSPWGILGTSLLIIGLSLMNVRLIINLIKRFKGSSPR